MKAYIALAAEAEDKRHERPVEIHDLFSRPIRPIKSWNEWLDRWQLAIGVEEMQGLLHVGLNVPLKGEWYEKVYTREDRLLFYFKIADGWTESYNLEKEDDPRMKYHFITGKADEDRNAEKSPSELRQILAQKAFDVLCTTFFRVSAFDHTREERYEWQNRWEKKVPPQILQAVMAFFRMAKGKYGSGISLQNLKYPSQRSHNEKAAIHFLMELSKFLWEWEERKIQSWDSPAGKTKIEAENQAMRAAIEAAKPWMVEVLVELGELNLLYQRMFSLEEACLEKLKEIAFRLHFSDGYNGLVKKARPVATIEEACRLNSPAAWFLKRRELMISEDKRLREIKAAEEEAEKAIQKRDKLLAKS